jgi:hypothetical protein
MTSGWRILENEGFTDYFDDADSAHLIGVG